jgi:hypothetical protein
LHARFMQFTSGNLTRKFTIQDTAELQLFLIQSQTSAASDAVRQISINQDSVMPYPPNITQLIV